jgi:formylglycine-generating enzyme required for sulfatase activity
MKMKLIPAGKFFMGSPDSDPDADNAEKPQHQVYITKSFYLGIYPVTRGQFGRFVEATRYRTDAEKSGGGWVRDVAKSKRVQNPKLTDVAKRKFFQKPKLTWRSPGFDQTDDHPVVIVSWKDTTAFCNALSKQEDLPPFYEINGQTVTIPDWNGPGYRLPTEAEWEYACRAGSKARYYFGDDPKALPSFAWFADNSGQEYWDSNQFMIDCREDMDKYFAELARHGCRTHSVGEKTSNGFGLYDMHGNVWEWCSDGYDADYYKEAPVADPRRLEGATRRVLRGGSWDNRPKDLRLAYRAPLLPDYWIHNLGFRLARVQSSR